MKRTDLKHGRELAAVSILLLVVMCTGSVSLAGAKDADAWAPREKLAVVLEGTNKSQQQLAAICKKHGISTVTFEQWKYKLLASANRVYGSEVRGVNIADESTRMTSFPVGIGGDVVQTELKDSRSGGILNWKPVVTSRMVWAQHIEHNALSNDDSSKAWAPMAGVGLALVKGKQAVSFSFLGSLDGFDDSVSYRDGWGNWDSTYSSRYYYGDIRYHKAMNNWLSLFAGYKVGYSKWSYSERGTTVGYSEKESGWGLGHGPIIGANISYPLKIKNIPLSVYGSFAFMPLGAIHSNSSGDINGVRSGGDSTGAGFFLNPEIGLKYAFSPSASISTSWLWHVVGSYGDGPSEMIHGPSISFSYKW